MEIIALPSCGNRAHLRSAYLRACLRSFTARVCVNVCAIVPTTVFAICNSIFRYTNIVACYARYVYEIIDTSPQSPIIVLYLCVRCSIKYHTHVQHEHI